MKVIKQSVEVMDNLCQDEILRKLEKCARVCYKSEDRIKDGSAAKFIRSVIDRGHESVIEHVGITVRFVTDRGVSHEIVRHRLASYSQTSTRYVNYDKVGDGEITVVDPEAFDELSAEYSFWYNGCLYSEKAYML